MPLLFETGTGMETSVKSFSWLIVIMVWSFTVSLLPMLSWLEMLSESLRCFSCGTEIVCVFGFPVSTFGNAT